MAYTLQMLKFLDGRPIIIDAGASQTFVLPDDATAAGHHLVAEARICDSSVGFRVLDHGGKQIHVWQVGDSDVWLP